MTEAPIDPTGTPTDKTAFIRAHTQIIAPPLVPEIRLHTASQITPIWEATEAALEGWNMPPPFWAFAWAGGQALARYLLDHPQHVAGKRVLDFAAGSGLASIAAKRVGARAVTANEIDAFAGAAIALNATENKVAIDIDIRDLIGSDAVGFDVVLAGDVCYERPMAARVEHWLRDLSRKGLLVLMGDPKRTYMPKQGLTRMAGYSVPTTRAIEDTDVRNAIVWQMDGNI